MKIGILGTRGIPNAYGGFEQFAQYLAEGLTAKGHDVSVYNSSTHPYKQDNWMGIKLIHCKDWEDNIGTAGQFVYDFNCLKDAAKRNFDILLQLGYTSNSIWFPIWPKKSINIVNMDGMEWKRSKYNRLTKKFLRLAESWAVKHADVLVSDSKGIQNYILEKYQEPSVYIPYGADIPSSIDTAILTEWDLQPYQYYLLMARMEPENNIEMIIRGYLDSERNFPLILIGNPGNEFGKLMAKKYPHPMVRFIGAIYKQDAVNNLRYYSSIYFHGHSVGGTNPSLLEAMACKCNIAAHDNIFNRAILEDNASYFNSDADVRDIINLQAPADVLDNRKDNNLEKIKTSYKWSKIVDDYERLFLEPEKFLKNK